MKAIFSVPLFVALVSMTGCKTSEANYRSAYEKAKEHGESVAVDKDVYEKIAQEEGPAMMSIGGCEFPGKALYITCVQEDGASPVSVRGYSVAAMRFKQAFNAGSVAKRLKEAGFGTSFVAKDRDGYYYAVAASVETASEAKGIIDKLGKSGINMVSPFPYVIIKPWIK